MKRAMWPWASAILVCAVSVALMIPVVFARDPSSGSSSRGPKLEMPNRPIMEAKGT